MKLKLLLAIFLIQGCNFFSAHSMTTDRDDSWNPEEICAFMETEIRLSDACFALVESQKIIPTIVLKKLVIHRNQAAQLYMRFYIRTYQDAACCADSTIFNTLSEYIREQEIHRHITTFFSNKKLEKLFIEQVEQIKKATDADKLPPPYWISEYSTQIPKPIIIPQSQWLETRQNALKKVKKIFEIF